MSAALVSRALREWAKNQTGNDMVSVHPSTLLDLTEMLEAAEAEAARLRKFADRYRWLRDTAASCTDATRPFICGANDLALHGDDADAEVDAAMAATR